MDFHVFRNIVSKALVIVPLRLKGVDPLKPTGQVARPKPDMRAHINGIAKLGYIGKGFVKNSGLVIANGGKGPKVGVTLGERNVREL